MTMHEEPQTIGYPSIAPGEGFEWVYDRTQGAYVETPQKEPVPQEEVLETVADVAGYTDYYGYYDSEGNPRITDIKRVPPRPGFRMVKVEGPIDPSMGQGAGGFWIEEPDLAPDTSLLIELDKARRSGNLKLANKLQEDLKFYQDTVNALTPYQRWAMFHQQEVDAQADAKRIDDQKNYEYEQLQLRYQREWERTGTDAERQAIQRRFETEQAAIAARFNTQELRLRAQEQRRQLEWNTSFAATENERQVAHTRWETEFGNGQYEFGATLGQRQLEFGTEMAQRQWESGQTAQREALKLGLQIQQSPGDWPAYQKLLRGNQPNVPYTGEQAISRTWADPWMQFANQPMPTIPQPAVPTLRPPALPARPERQLPQVMGQVATPDVAPGESDWEKYLAAKAVAPPFVKREPTPEEWAAAGGPPPPPGTFGTGTNVPTSQVAVAGGGTVALPEVRFDARHPVTGEEISIRADEIPGFDEAGFDIVKAKPAFDHLPFGAPQLGANSNPFLSQLPERGLREALFGQPVSQARQLPTLGGPTFPSAQSWTRLLPSEQEMFRGEVRTLGLPEQDYWAQWARLQPSWGTPGRFRRAPTTMGFTGG